MHVMNTIKKRPFKEMVSFKRLVLMFKSVTYDTKPTY